MADIYCTADELINELREENESLAKSVNEAAESLNKKDQRIAELEEAVKHNNELLLINELSQTKVYGTVFRSCPDRNCKYSRLIFIKRPGTPKGKGTAVCGLGWTEEDCDKLREG